MPTSGFPVRPDVVDSPIFAASSNQRPARRKAEKKASKNKNSQQKVRILDIQIKALSKSLTLYELS